MLKYALYAVGTRRYKKDKTLRFTSTTLEELNLLLQFNVATSSTGIKVHSTTRPEVIKACQSLFDKGLVSQRDGGYLTDSGIEALGHAQTFSGLLAQKG
jgi:uncharacterized protein (TIGR02647 family)